MTFVTLERQKYKTH